MEHGTTTRRATEASGTQASETEAPDVSALDTAPAAPAAGSRPERRVLGRHAPSWWPLVAVLVVQAALSLRLVGADTAFEDEATYLWAGHLEWANWLHGTPIPPFSAYFSGAPVIYPPIGALADSLGGLTAARLLSLAFMLGATALLWSAASRLYGSRAAFFAAALFAVCGPTLHLGSFATYDAMAVFLIALAAWCVIGAGDSGDATGRMVAAGAVLALANAAAYSSVLFDPIVILLALLTAFPKPGGKVAARRIAILLVVLVTLLLVGLLIGGSSYVGGFERTTLMRVPGGCLLAHRAARFLVVDRYHHGSRGVRGHHQPGEPAGARADMAAGGPDRRRDPGAPGASAAAHRGLARQARGPGGLVRRHRRGLRGGLVYRGRARGAEPGPHHRGLRARAGLPDIAGGQPVGCIRHQLG